MAKSLVKSFVGFLGHYADEALAVSSALKATLAAININPDDKAHIITAIERLEKLPENIAKSVSELVGVKETEVKISKRDLAEVVAAELPSALSSILPGLVEAQIAEGVRSSLPMLADKAVSDALAKATKP